VAAVVLVAAEFANQDVVAGVAVDLKLLDVLATCPRPLSPLSKAMCFLLAMPLGCPNGIYHHRQ
jgi:hypothetical protein